MISLLVIMLTFACLINGCGTDEKNKTNNLGYVLNIRTGRIHSGNCQYVGRINDRNKLETNETLLDLLKENYVICRKCKAGIKQAWIQYLKDRVIHPNLFVDDVMIKATNQDYLKAIDETSEWYVEHVPTYASLLQTEKLGEYSGNSRFYKYYTLHNNGQDKEYVVISDEVGSNEVSALTKNVEILRGSEAAAQYYSDSVHNIDFHKQIAYYPADGYIGNSRYNKPGDDCVRYIFAVFNRMDDGFTDKYEKLTGRTFSNTNSTMLTENNSDIAFGLMNLGFEIYDTHESAVHVNSDGVPEGYILKINEGFKLKKGDIIARKGHVHIYLGDGKNIEAYNFGWGRVYRDYPQIRNIQMVEHDDGIAVELLNTNGEAEIYTRIYRYTGRGMNE